MEMRLICMALICLGIAQWAFAHEDRYPFESPEQSQRFVRFIKEVRCLVCESQSLFEASSNYADGLRWQIYEMFKSGMTESYIRTDLKRDYGDFILFSSPVSQATFLLWYGPIIMFGLGIYAIWRYSFQL